MSASPKKLAASIEDGFLVIKVPMNSTPVRSFILDHTPLAQIVRQEVP